MHIANNVIAHKLQNVYWILGGSCGGKSTAASLLAEKYGFYHYNGDERMWTHCQIAVPELQPAIKRRFDVPEDPFLLSPEEHQVWQSAIYDEMTDMVIADLIELSSAHQRIVYEGEINKERIIPVIAARHVAYLYADSGMVIKEFFDRPDNHMYNAIKGLKLSPEKGKAVFENFNKILSRDICDVEDRGPIVAQEQGWLCYRRTENSTIADMMEQIVMHFELE